VLNANKACTTILLLQHDSQQKQGRVEHFNFSLDIRILVTGGKFRRRPRLGAEGYKYLYVTEFAIDCLLKKQDT
jgi:hypothetical protein